MRLKGFFLLQIVIITITAVLGQLGKANMQNSGIQDVRTIDGIYNMDVTITSILKDEDYDGFIEYRDDYVRSVDASSIAAIVKPTGNIRPYDIVLRYEVTVEEVIQGDKGIENQTIQIFDSPKFTVNMANSGRLEYRDIKNVMQPGHRYLAFFSPLAINDYLKEDAYCFIDSFFNYVDLDYDGIVPIRESLDFRDVRDREYFSSSQRTLEVLMEIKRNIIDNYSNQT